MMERTHVNEHPETGRVLFCRTDSPGNPIHECVIIRTRAMVFSLREYEPLPPSFLQVMIPVLAASFEIPCFIDWFNDWKAEDNMDGHDYQSGRPVDIAVPLEEYHRLLQPGARGEASYPKPDAGMFQRPRPFSSPITAVRVDNGPWIEPAAEPVRVRIPPDPPVIHESY